MYVHVCWKCLYNNNGITHRSLIRVCVWKRTQHRYINTQQHPTTPRGQSIPPLDYYPLPIFVSTFLQKNVFFFSFSCFNDPCFLLLLSALLFSLHCTWLYTCVYLHIVANTPTTAEQSVLLLLFLLFRKIYMYSLAIDQKFRCSSIALAGKYIELLYYHPLGSYTSWNISTDVCVL